MNIHPTILQMSKRLLHYLPLPTGIAFVVFLVTLSHNVCPGQSAALTAAAAGLVSPSGADHSVYALALRAVENLDLFSLPIRVNLFSALCGTLCVAVFYHLVSRLILFLAYESSGGEGRYQYGETQEMSQELLILNRKILLLAIGCTLTSAFLLIFQAPFWSAATRAHFATFDLLLALAAFDLLLTYDTCEDETSPRTPSNRHLFLFLSFFLFTVGLFDSAVFLLLLPVYTFFIAHILFYSQARGRLLGIIVAAGAAGVACSLFAFFHNRVELIPSRLTSALLVSTSQFVSHHYHEIGIFFPRTAWALIALQVGVMAIFLFFGANRIFRAEVHRRIPCILLLILFATPSLLNLSISPNSCFLHLDHLSVFSSVFAAVSIGFALMACLKILVLPHGELFDETEEESHDPITRRFRVRQTFSFYCAFAAFVVAATQILFVPWRNFIDASTRTCSFADEIAHALIESMGTRTCMISNGCLDNHLLIQAFLAKHPLKLISLQQTMGVQEFNNIKTWIAQDPLFEGMNRIRLQNAFAISTVRFLLEWFRNDPHITEHTVVFASPDLWTSCGFNPIPEGLVFSGWPASTPLTNAAALADQNRRLISKISLFLQENKRENQQLAALRWLLRMRVGFASNEMGVLLEENKMTEEALDAYMYSREIDPLNISATINSLVLISTKQIHPELVEKLQKTLRSLSSDKYIRALPLAAILQVYGTIRQSDVFLKQGFMWSARGDSHVAVAKISKATELSQKTGTSVLIDNAMFYLQAGALEKAEECCKAALDKDPSNVVALSAMATLSLNLRRVNEAGSWIKKAIKNGAQDNLILYQTIVLALFNQNYDQAQRLLEKATKDYPSDQRYWLLYADVLLGKNATHEVEFRVLPAMQKALNNQDHFLLHTVRGFLLRKKGARFYQDARHEFILALTLNALLPDVWSALFDLDLKLGNPAFTETDAKKQLAVDPDHALANYLMGVAYLNRNALKESEDFLRRSIEKHPTAPACNDLGENLRQQNRLTEAEVFVRQALSIQPDFAPALDTLACILVDGGKAGDALPFAEKANEIAPHTPAFQLTLLAIRVKQRDQTEVTELMDELSRSKTPIPEKLQKEIQALNQKNVPTASPKST